MKEREGRTFEISFLPLSLSILVLSFFFLSFISFVRFLQVRLFLLVLVISIQRRKTRRPVVETRVRKVTRGRKVTNRAREAKKLRHFSLALV